MAISLTARKAAEVRRSSMQTFLLALLTSTSVANLIIFFVNRHDAKKKNPVKDLEDKIDRYTAERKEVDADLNRSLLRLQMLNLMDHRPDDVGQLMLIAEQYFNTLNGNWYMDGLFKQHCETHNIPLPSWFESK